MGEWRVAVGVGLCLLAVGCSADGGAGGTANEIAGPTSEPGVSTALTTAQQDSRPAANPDDYAVGDGKHAFRLESVRAGCWFNPNNHDESAPHMSCTLPLPKTDPPITDLNTGLVEPANSVVIDAEHARKAINVAGGMLAGPVLPAGSTLTVGALECTAVSGTSLSCCRGPAGSFVFDGDRAAAEVTDLGVPAATKQTIAPTSAALGAGQACGEVRAGSEAAGRCLLSSFSATSTARSRWRWRTAT